MPKVNMADIRSKLATPGWELNDFEQRAVLKELKRLERLEQEYSGLLEAYSKAMKEYEVRVR